MTFRRNRNVTSFSKDGGSQRKSQLDQQSIFPDSKQTLIYFKRCVL